VQRHLKQSVEKLIFVTFPRCLLAKLLGGKAVVREPAKNTREHELRLYIVCFPPAEKNFGVVMCRKTTHGKQRRFRNKFFLSFWFLSAWRQHFRCEGLQRKTHVVLALIIHPHPCLAFSAVYPVQIFYLHTCPAK